MPIRARIFIVLTALSGAAVVAASCLHWHSDNPVKFFCYLLIALLASTMKVELPGIDSTMSVTFLFVLLGILELSLGETLLIGCSAACAQCTWKTEQKPEAVKVIFNVFSNQANAVFLAYLAYHGAAHYLHASSPLLLLVAGCTFFLANTIIVSAVIALVSKQSLRSIWGETYFWSLAYNLAGAALVGMVHVANRYVGWETSILLVPVMFVIFRSYQLYLGRLDEQKKRVRVEELQVLAEKEHVERVCALHLRTIEGLALAIDAKDHTTHGHLYRVRTYAVEIGKEMGLDEDQLDALRAAALLHDIGKLAVPDHIINKPGRLTPEEFEKMKIHPIVGGDILERVAFPYPVAPIVRAHHEKWNGKGYPDGLKGEEIPVGARILSAVDCLDAVASDRQYRKALSLEEAMKVVVQETATSFDPAVVAILQRRFHELEAMASQGREAAAKGSLHFGKVARGDRPATGFQIDATQARANHSDFLSSIASARQEAYTLFELSQDLGNSLSVDETLSLVALRLRKLVPYDSIAAFLREGDDLVPGFVSGDNFKALSSLRVKMGKGLCGWVAQNAIPIINGNPAVEEGFEGDPKMTAVLRSALVVPLMGVSGLVGVLALYQTEMDAFTNDHLRILQVITAKLAHFLENALKYQQAEDSATNDFLTGLPNARALSIYLDGEIERCKREFSSLAVMVCDLDGFKQVNDRYGHLAGDKVLKIFANLMRAVCRGYDYCARMGGDEFVVIVPSIGPEAVREKAGLLSSLAQQACLEVCGADLLSLSLGAAFYPQDGSDTEHLLAEADKKMYAAKQLHNERRRLIAQASQRTVHVTTSVN
jgi:diguanylate cyclase (GGDEF)-like protein/putative nucleotidyltransferase with HDIG domain